METMNKEEIKEHFIKYAIMQNDALKNGNGKKANQFHKKIWNLYHDAKKQNYIEIFKECLDNTDENVKSWAAGFSYLIDSKLAKNVLTKLLKSSDPAIWLSAKAMLDSFNNGEWEKRL